MLCKSSTAQDMCQPFPVLISCVGVTGRWRLWSRAQNAVTLYVAGLIQNVSRSSSKASSLYAAVYRSKIVVIVIVICCRCVCINVCGAYRQHSHVHSLHQRCSALQISVYMKFAYIRTLLNCLHRYCTTYCSIHVD